MSRYQRQLKGGNPSNGKAQSAVVRGHGRKESLEKTQLRIEGDEIDSIFGFDRMKEGPTRLGWLLNYLPITMPDDTGIDRSGLDLYFLDRNGGNFKASIFHQPFFYLDLSDPRRILEMSQHLLRRFEGCVIEEIEKEDLELANHLSGKKHKFLKISFSTVNDLVDCKQQLRPIIQRNKKREASEDNFETNDVGNGIDKALSGSLDPLEYLIDMREFDIPYTMRVAIDLELRVGAWYEVTPESGSECCKIVWQRDMLELCDLRILAFDIECEKSPLKFPDASRDRVFMISYMISGQGYLLINRDLVSEDIQDFEYTPLSKLPGPFKVFNEPNEEAILTRFIRHIQELKPHVFVSYNGDFFDWPFLEKRCDSVAGLSLYREIGIKSAPTMGGGVTNEYTGRCIVHLDAFCWVQRDSYLPQGNQNLKAVTRYKLGYDPIEVDPEDMVRFARERPAHMASYSVSDAVATYYLYTTYVHNFIFSLSTIIPMGPEDVLRKGSGTLCEALLVVEANRGNIICPNKHEDPLESFHNGHLIQSETYIGGHVECLEAGVFRADIPAKFKMIPAALQQLIDNIDRDLTFAIETEHDIQRSEISNYDTVRQSIVERLEMLRDCPLREEFPAIYHLDVGAMYPNIILTNRLQPSAMVSQHDCAACDYNRAENNCKRPMVWMWRGDMFPATHAEYQSAKRQLAYEKSGQNYSELSDKQQAELIKDRLKSYSNRVYKKNKITTIVDKVNTVCMRENAFYVNTVRAFRDRRYDYKLLTKQWKGKKTDADKKGDVIARKVAEDKEVLMDSLQLAHKCILNSFYGYVMRKGARWRSMEMAGIVTKTGAELIKQARELVEQVGRPLELDTDGIWCILPASFPQEVKFKTKSGEKLSFAYPCAMLNADVHDRYTNHQYQDLVTVAGSSVRSHKYVSHSECSIYFELDGPYKAMVLPASPEEGKLLKKKYAVFNFDGTIAELKGFEIKRRGELEIVKAFQSQVFEQFLSGSSLIECYKAVGSIGNQWLDVLDRHGYNLDDEELLHLISERKTISKTLDDYEGRKATSLTSASRLADFLGAEMVKDKGLNCNLIISKYPAEAPVAERAIPVAIFSADLPTKRYYLRKWMKDPSFDCSDFRDVVDWDYYKGRLGGTIQKIITIPAGIQGVANPCPRIEHPVWLQRKLNEGTGLKQTKLTALFASMKSVASKTTAAAVIPLPAPKLVATASPHKAVPVAAASPLKAIAMSQGSDVEDDTELLLGSGTSKLLSPAGKKKKLTAETPPESRRKRNLFGTPETGEKLASTPGDIEDMLGSGNQIGSGGRPVVHYRPSPAAMRIRESVGQLEFDESTKASAKSLTSDLTGTIQSVPPTPVATNLLCSQLETESDFNSWLATRKTSWKQKRQTKRVAALSRAGKSRGNHNQSQLYAFGEDPEDAGARKKPVSVADFVRNATLHATHGYWQIIELQEMDSPGDFTVWAMTSRTQLQRFRLTVPRIMYVNCNGQAAENAARSLAGIKLKRDLPHGRACLSLYEISISERSYQRNEDKFSLFLSDPQVEGVYETQTPLWFRTVLQTGCVAKLSSNADAKSSQYKVKDLEFVNVMAHPYLEANSATFRRIFLYGAVDKKNSRTGFAGLGMFIVEGNNSMMELDQDEELLSAKAYFWLANGGFSLDSKPPLQRFYRNLQPSERANVKFSTKFTANFNEALKLCNDALTAYLREKHGPTVVVAQGGLGVKQWRRNLPILSEFPMTLIPAHSQDDAFPALGWQNFVAERMIHRFLVFPLWLRDRLHCARHAHVPICNLGPDSLTTMIDVHFARQLHHNRHLLWASEGLHPDLGGAEADENFLWSDALKEPIMNMPGAYRSVCVELELYGLAIAAILGSGVLDAEGLTALSVSAPPTSDSAGPAVDPEQVSSFAVAGNNTSSANFSFSTDTSCARAFMLLKAVVTKWVDDAKVRGDAISESMLMALYRYLCGYGDSLLQDPSLHRIVYNLMSKLFKRLIGHMKKLGVRIIYASYSKIIVHTNKWDVSAAVEYIDYVISTLLSNDLFSYMEITPKAYWEQLLWLGPENWGGLTVVEESEEVIEPEDDDNDNDDEAAVIAIDRVTSPAKPASSEKATKPKSWFPSRPSNTSAEYDFLDHLLSPKKSDKSKKNKRKDSVAKQARRFNDDPDFDEDIEADDDDDDKDSDKPNDDDDNDDEPIPINNDVIDVDTKPASSDPRSLLRSNWNLASYLPETVSSYFNELIGEFLLQYRKRRSQLARQRDEYLSSGSQFTQPPSMSIPMDDAAIEESVVVSMRNLVRKKLTTQMLGVVDGLAEVFSHNYDRKQREENTAHALNMFPQQAGSHLQLTSPALEFVKATTHVMSLDGELAEEVLAMKRLLLTQLRVKEFSSESQFQDPCLSFVLRDVICGFCSTCRDIDLLRDPVIASPEMDRAKRWVCTHCYNSLNTEQVENRLLDEIGRRCTAFVLQDFRCSKTHLVSTRYCATSSDLCAPLTMDVDPKSIQDELMVLMRVAKFHEFPLLMSTLEDMNQQFVDV